MLAVLFLVGGKGEKRKEEVTDFAAHTKKKPGLGVVSLRRSVRVFVAGKKGGWRELTKRGTVSFATSHARAEKREDATAIRARFEEKAATAPTKDIVPWTEGEKRGAAPGKVVTSAIREEKMRRFR